LKDYGIKNPQNLLNLNENFILSLQTFEKGGTYSQKEKEFYEYQINQINEEKIKKQKKEREKLNNEVITKVKLKINIIFNNICSIKVQWQLN